jgi:hypothetical protein
MTEVVTIPFSICVGGEDAIWLVVGWLMCDDVTMSDEKKRLHHMHSFLFFYVQLARLFGLSAFLDKKIDAMTIERDPIEPTLGREWSSNVWARRAHRAHRAQCSLDRTDTHGHDQKFRIGALKVKVSDGLGSVLHHGIKIIFIIIQ